MGPGELDPRAAAKKFYRAMILGNPEDARSVWLAPESIVRDSIAIARLEAVGWRGLSTLEAVAVEHFGKSATDSFRAVLGPMEARIGEIDSAPMTVEGDSAVIAGGPANSIPLRRVSGRWFVGSPDDRRSPSVGLPDETLARLKEEAEREEARIEEISRKIRAGGYSAPSEVIEEYHLEPLIRPKQGR